MTDYLSYLLMNKSYYFFKFLQFTMYDGQLRTSLRVFQHGAQATDVTFSLSCELSQPMEKTEFSSAAKNKTNSIS